MITEANFLVQANTTVLPNNFATGVNAAITDIKSEILSVTHLHFSLPLSFHSFTMSSPERHSPACWQPYMDLMRGCQRECCLDIWMALE